MNNALPGLGPDLAQAYALLLGEPSLGFPEFAVRLGATVADARIVLDQLAAMSLIEQREAELVAVSPLLAMQQLIAHEHNLMEQRQEFLRMSYKTLAQVMPSYSTRPAPTPNDPVTEQLDDLAAIRLRLEELAVGARLEVLSLSPAASNPTSTRAASRSLDLGALERGVQMRTVYLDSIAYDVSALMYADELINAGGQVRIAPALPMRLLIVDNAVAVVPKNPDDSSEGCLIIHHHGTVAALTALFESYWRSGRELSRDGDSDTECSAVEQAILRMLTGGAKDDAVARQLGVSVRTVRRCIADLMARVDASSRFELGVRAAVRGWV